MAKSNHNATFYAYLKLWILSDLKHSFPLALVLKFCFWMPPNYSQIFYIPLWSSVWILVLIYRTDLHSDGNIKENRRKYTSPDKVFTMHRWWAAQPFSPSSHSLPHTSSTSLPRRQKPQAFTDFESFCFTSDILFTSNATVTTLEHANFSTNK